MIIGDQALRAAEEALRASEAKYRTLFNSIDEGFCLIEVLFDGDGRAFDYRFLEANPAFEKHTGLKIQDAIGRTVRSLVPGHEEHWYEIYGKIALSGEPQRFEQQAGMLGRHYDLYAFRTGRAGQHHVAVLFTDITARKEAEAAVEADLRAMKILQELGARLIPETDTGTLYGEINDAAIRLTHADAGTVQILDQRTCELVLLATRGFPPDSSARFGRVNAGSATSCGVALASGRRTVLDFDDPSLEDAKGDLRWHVEAGYLSAQSTPLLSRTGVPIGMLSTHWSTRRRLTGRESRHLDLLARQAADLIEQRLAFARLQAARTEAENAGRAKDHFLAVLSHELRTPLTPVLMQVEMLLEDFHGQPEVTAALNLIHRNVLLETRLIDDLLDVTRIGRGKLEIERRPLPAHEAVRGALTLCRPDIEAKGQQLTLALEADSDAISGDMVRLQQVFTNLVKNASKFTGRGGRIRLTSRSGDSLLPDGGPCIRILVEDSGIGWDPASPQPIFDPFVQGEPAITKTYGGLGLGLAIARAIITAHGGSLEGSSPGPDQGAIFTVTLPLAG